MTNLNSIVNECVLLGLAKCQDLSLAKELIKKIGVGIYQPLNEITKNPFYPEIYYLPHVIAKEGNIKVLEMLPVELLEKKMSHGRTFLHEGAYYRGIDFVRNISELEIFPKIKHLFWIKDHFEKSGLDDIKIWIKKKQDAPDPLLFEEWIEEEVRDLF